VANRHATRSRICAKMLKIFLDYSIFCPYECWGVPFEILFSDWFAARKKYDRGQIRKEIRKMQKSVKIWRKNYILNEFVLVQIFSALTLFFLLFFFLNIFLITKSSFDICTDPHSLNLNLSVCWEDHQKHLPYAFIITFSMFWGEAFVSRAR